MADAKITVGADVSAVERAFAKAKTMVREQASEMVSAMGSAAKSVVGSFTDVAFAQSKINFSSQAEQVRAFEASTARLAVSMGRDLEGVRSSIEETGKAIGKRPQEVAQWASEVGKLTYNFGGAADSIRGMSALAAKTGRDVGEYKGLSVELGRMGVEGKNTTDVLATMAAQAEAFGTVGGVAALTDQFEQLGDAVTKMSKGVSATALSGFVATVGKGLNAQAGARVASSMLGSLQSDPRGWERYLGHHILDEKGQVSYKDKSGKELGPGAIFQEIYNKMSKTYGTGETLRNVALNTFDPETAMAIINQGKTGALGKGAAGIGPQKGFETAQQAYLKTDAGKRDVATAELSVASRSLSGSSTALGKAADMLQAFASKNPFTSTLAASVGGAMVNKQLGSAGKIVTGLIQGGTRGEQSLAEGLGAFGGKAGMQALGKAGLYGALAAEVAGIGYAGYQAYEAKGEKDKVQARIARESADIGTGYADKQARIKELESTGMGHGLAVNQAERERVEKFEKRLDPKDITAAMVEGVVKGMKGVQLVTPPKSPTSVVEDSSSSPASGNQSGGQ